MEQILWSVVFLLLSSEIVVNMIVFGLSYNLHSKTKLRVVSILACMYLVYLSFLTFEFIFFILNESDLINAYLSSSNILICSMFPFFGGISAGIFVMFIDYYKEETIPALHIGFYGAFLGSFLLNLIYHYIYPDIELIEIIRPIVKPENLRDILTIVINILFSTNFPTAYFVLFAIITLLNSLRSIDKLVTVHEKKQKRQIQLLQLTIILYYLFPAVVIIFARFFSDFMTQELYVLARNFIPHIFVLMGHITIYFAYIRGPNGFLQFSRNEKLIVMNRAGVPLFIYDFRPNKQGNKLRTEKDENKDILLTGGVNAIINLFLELIETKEIKMITFEDKKLLLVHNKNFVIFLITGRATQFVWSALESFSVNFDLQYGTDSTELSVVPKHIYSSASRLVEIAFGIE